MRIRKLSLCDAAMPDKRGHPINLAHTENKAVTPIKPAAQKFHRLIFCNLLDNSLTLFISSMPDLLLRKCHIADVNQHAADPHPVIIAAVSMSDLIVHPVWSNNSSEALSPVHVAALWDRRQKVESMEKRGFALLGRSLVGTHPLRFCS
ncbi:MAG: hypothetical protein DME65_02825 [Verrucomicrobia bacterium]|nr:MAG: hypothetical protein DME65_02825 [Verrucomicrobiota bacterium]